MPQPAAVISSVGHFETPSFMAVGDGCSPVTGLRRLRPRSARAFGSAAPGRPSNPSLPKRNRSLVTPPVKFRILKIHATETRREKRPPRWEAPDFPRQRPAHCPLTFGNVGGSPTPGNHTAETALAGWGARIRTSAFLKSICLNYRTNFGPFRENWPPETPLRSCERQKCPQRFEVTLCQGVGI